MVKTEPRPKPRPQATDALPPNDLTAERAVLGACMLSGDAIDTAGLQIGPEHFYADRHATIWREMSAMRGDNVPVDAMTLAERLSGSGKLADAGGVEYLVECMESVPNAHHVEHYAEIVLDRSRRRAAIMAAREVMAVVGDVSADTGEALAKAEREIHAALEHGSAVVDTSIESALLEAVTNSREQRQPGLTLQMPTVDSILGDMTPGNVVIIGARPSVGKTALAMTILRKLAETGVPGVLFSYEMSRLEIAERMICAAACVRMDQLRRNTLTTQECDRILQEAAIMGKLPLYIDDSDRNLPGLISTMRVMVRRHRARIVVIDYLQLVPSGEKFQIREQEIAHISRSLKRAAKALGVVMIVLCQLNRAADVLRENESPRLSHLRESGSIEQDADKVLFLWRPNKGMEGVDASRVDDHGMLSVAKNRQGQLGQIKLAWNGPAFSYSDWSGSSVPDVEIDAATGEWP